MYNLSKTQIKIRLVISLILAIIWTVVMTMMEMMEGEHIIVFVLAPVVMTWALSTITFGPVVYLENMILPSFKAALYLITFRFGDAIASFIHPFVWYFKALIEVIKLTFKSFTKDEN